MRTVTTARGNSQALCLALLVATWIGGCASEQAPELRVTRWEQPPIEESLLDLRYSAASQEMWQLYSVPWSDPTSSPWITADSGVVSHSPGHGRSVLLARKAGGTLAIDRPGLRFLASHSRVAEQPTPQEWLERTLGPALRAALDSLKQRPPGLTAIVNDKSIPGRIEVGETIEPALPGRPPLQIASPLDVLSLGRPGRSLSYRRFLGPLAIRGRAGALDTATILAVLSIQYDILVVSSPSGKQIEAWLIPSSAPLQLPWIKVATPTTE